MNYLMGQSCMWYLLTLSVCIGQGDGRWKGHDRENLHQDIVAYRKMAEKLEQEIEAYYDEYPNGWLRGDNVDRIRNKYLTNILNRNTEITKNSENTDEKKHTFAFVAREKYETVTIEPKTDASKRLVQIAPKTSEWPSFQNILLAMGRKYDWKNDRWIKVRQKPKVKADISIPHNDVSISEKHKFSYSIIKLSKSKNKRNVVVAVSAVR